MRIVLYHHRKNHDLMIENKKLSKKLEKIAKFFVIKFY